MWLSILGMYEHDETLFDGLAVPSGINKLDVVDNILIECAELEIIYPNIEILKRAINIWSASEQISWQKLYNTMTVEYNPIWNVDADITERRVINREGSGNNENIDSVQGFNSSTWAESNKNDGEFSNEENVIDEFTSRRKGNIGVTASQDLIKKEREVAEFNIINHITKSFKMRFCLLVY